MSEISIKERLRRERKSKIMEEKWQDPEYRAHMVRKQKQLGYRL